MILIIDGPRELRLTWILLTMQLSVFMNNHRQNLLFRNPSEGTSNSIPMLH